MIVEFAMPPEPMLSYGRVKWDRDVWDRMLPTIRHNSDENMDEVISVCVHRCMFSAFERLDMASSALGELCLAIDSLDRRSTTLKADMFLSLEDFNRVRESCDSIISMARSIRADPVNVAQASVLLAVTP